MRPRPRPCRTSRPFMVEIWLCSSDEAPTKSSDERQRESRTASRQVPVHALAVSDRRNAVSQFFSFSGPSRDAAVLVAHDLAALELDDAFTHLVDISSS